MTESYVRSEFMLPDNLRFSRQHRLLLQGTSYAGGTKTADLAFYVFAEQLAFGKMTLITARDALTGRIDRLNKKLRRMNMPIQIRSINPEELHKAGSEPRYARVQTQYR